jgi:hypothetical protein
MRIVYVNRPLHSNPRVRVNERTAIVRQQSFGVLARAEMVVVIPKMRRPYKTAFTMSANDIVLPYQFKASRKTPSPL